MGMPLCKVSGSLRHLILTPVSSVTFTPSPDTAMAMPLLSVSFLSLSFPQTLALGFMTGTISRYIWGQTTMLWEVCVMGERASLGWQSCAWGKWWF